ncbi:MAG TPA: S8 family serine peptidase [Longimicrobium sp.]|nr:S8 family serine peptidase [Longimicrobium sp.]
MQFQVKHAVARAGAAALVALLAACSDLPVSPRGEQEAETAAPALAASPRAPRDVPAVRIDLPAAPRKWDNDPAALADAVAQGGGYAVVAFKEPGSARALATGHRGAVTAGTVRAGLELLGRKGVEVVELLDGIGAARVRMTPQAAEELAAHPLVDFVEPRQYGTIQAQTTPWGITMVEAPTFWSAQGATGAGAKLEIIDTGHQQGHADLPAVPSANCSGVYTGCADASTASWHGTHVLGIAAARNNTIGVVGVAPGIAAADVFMYGACTDFGSCPTDEVTAGINAGIFNTHVMNLSLSQPYDAAQSTAVSQAWANGIVIVAAAGNNLSNTTIYPAAYTNVIGVSGVNSNKTFASSGTTGCSGYSNYGSHVDLAAPFSAYSTIGGNSYGTLCGTSMASPHVAGVAALIKSKYPTWTNTQIVNHLFNTAEDLGAAGKDVYFGYGLVRARAAVTPVCTTISGPASITTAGTYTWTASACGGNGTYTYQWQYRTQGSATWTNVGTNSSSYSRSVAAGDADFELRVTVTSGGVSASDTHLVDVNIPGGTLTVSVSGSDYLMNGESGSWEAIVTGGTGTYSYQWQYRTEITSTWTNVGTNSPFYSRAAGIRSFYVRVTVTSGTSVVTSPEHYVYVEYEPMCGEVYC